MAKIILTRTTNNGRLITYHKNFLSTYQYCFDSPNHPKYTETILDIIGASKKITIINLIKEEK